MPFIANTPESLVSRSDSKNPSTTCRGITASGRPCRRPITPGPNSQSQPPNLTIPLPRSVRKLRVVEDDPRDESLYCWQHKDQASLSARSSPGPRASSTPILEERTSLDTLADRLGIIELENKKQKKKAQKQQSEKYAARNSSDAQYSASQGTSRPKPSKRKELQCCFCFSVPLDEVQESAPPPRPQPKPVQNSGSASVPRPAKQGLAPPTSSPKPKNYSSGYASGKSPSKNSYKSARSRTSTTSQTAQYLDLIPPTTDPQTASSLMAELARPYVESEEPGYIYMFWMTPPSAKAKSPPVDAARSLLAPPSPAGGSRSRRPSDVVSSFAKSTSASSSKTMLLKIGRATNVQRRMQQWTRQCGYEIEVIRYYPYLPGASEASGEMPRMTPHCHRVERLVHIELAGMGLKATRGSCESCGKDHREWFEVDATRDGVGTVDGVIRRWVDWDEEQV